MAKPAVFLFQGDKLLEGKTENITFCIVLAGMLQPFFSARLFARSYNKFANEFVSLGMAWMQRITAAVFVVAFFIFIYERTSHNLPIWWKYDNYTVVLLIAEVLCLFLFIWITNPAEKIRERWQKLFTDPAKEGYMMAGVALAVQIPLGLSIIEFGHQGIHLGTIIMGYVIPFARMLMLINTTAMSRGVSLKVGSTNPAKVGQSIGDIVFLICWVFVTILYALYP